MSQWLKIDRKILSPSSCLPLLAKTTPCPKKTKQICFLSELRQISTNFDNFCQKDGKRSKYMRGALIFHLT